MEGRGVDTAHCHCYSPPLKKMAASIKPLMIPTLCHGRVGEGGRSPGELESEAEKR